MVVGAAMRSTQQLVSGRGLSAKHRLGYRGRCAVQHGAWLAHRGQRRQASLSVVGRACCHGGPHVGHGSRCGQMRGPAMDPNVRAPWSLGGSLGRWPMQQLLRSPPLRGKLS